MTPDLNRISKFSPIDDEDKPEKKNVGKEKKHLSESSTDESSSQKLLESSSQRLLESSIEPAKELKGICQLLNVISITYIFKIVTF